MSGLWKIVPVEHTHEMLVAAQVAVGSPSHAGQIWDAMLQASPPAPEKLMLERALDLLAAIIDEPLATLPGGAEAGWRGPLNLYFSAFRPDVSEKVAALLEDAGR